MIWYAQNICSFTGSKPRKVLISPSILARNVQNARQYRLNNTFCSSLYISFPPGQTSITFHRARKNDHMVLHILSFMAERWNLQLKSLFSSTFFLNQTHQSWWITLKYIFCDPYIDCKNILYIYIYFINRAKWMYILHLWIYILPKWITYKILHKIFNEIRRTKMKLK